MTFLLAHTFTDSLARLKNEEQKAVKTTTFDMQVNPANPGMKLHKLDKAKDKNFWSVRVSADTSPAPGHAIASCFPPPGQDPSFWRT